MIHAKMEKLLILLASQDDLPFRTNINEQLVLDAIIEANGTIDNDMKNKIKQWIKFNRERLEGEFVSIHEREQIPENIKEQLIVELYSK